MEKFFLQNRFLTPDFDDIEFQWNLSVEDINESNRGYDDAIAFIVTTFNCSEDPYDVCNSIENALISVFLKLTHDNHSKSYLATHCRMIIQKISEQIECYPRVLRFLFTRENEASFIFYAGIFNYLFFRN